MLICDACNAEYHTYCLQLPGVPSTPLWVCPYCTAAGITEDTLQKARQEATATTPERDLFPSPAQRYDDATAQRLDGASNNRHHTGWHC
jgi:hypothetical protein